VCLIDVVMNCIQFGIVLHIEVFVCLIDVVMNCLVSYEKGISRLGSHQHQYSLKDCRHYIFGAAVAT
jgi:hypothetical protein